MALVHVNWRPDRGELRTFGFICLVAFGLLGAWLFFRHSIFGLDLRPDRAQTAAYVSWALAAFSLLSSLSVPQALRPLYIGLTAISLPIGFVVSHVLMAFVFYGLLTPVGLFFRLTGRDALQRRFEPTAKTYWQARRVVNDKRQYFRQF